MKVAMHDAYRHTVGASQRSKPAFRFAYTGIELPSHHQYWVIRTIFRKPDD